MVGTCSVRYTTIAALGLLAVLWGHSGAAQPPDAAEVLEVKVLEAQANQGQGEGTDVHFRMEVLSVLRSASRVQPGETVMVRSTGQSTGSLAPGWTGTAYLNPDPSADRTGDGRRFVTAVQGESLVELPPGPPSATFTPVTPKGGK